MSVVSDKVISISKKYFGPATEPFLTRQCKAYLKVELNDLTAAHLKDLAKWVEVGAGLIMDPAKATEVSQKISMAAN
jgi:hypothetical protein